MKIKIELNIPSEIEYITIDPDGEIYGHVDLPTYDETGWHSNKKLYYAIGFTGEPQNHRQECYKIERGSLVKHKIEKPFWLKEKEWAERHGLEYV